MSDIDDIKLGVQRRLPNASFLHPIEKFSDDPFIPVWFFRLRGAYVAVRLESPDGMCPFLVVHERTKPVQSVERTVEEVVTRVVALLSS